MTQYPLYKVKAKRTVTITNGAGDTMIIPMNGIATMQQIFDPILPVSNNVRLAEAKYNGSTIQFYYHGLPASNYGLKPLLVADFNFLVDDTASPNTSVSRFDGDGKSQEQATSLTDGDTAIITRKQYRNIYFTSAGIGISGYMIGVGIQKAIKKEKYGFAFVATGLIIFGGSLWLSENPFVKK